MTKYFEIKDEEVELKITWEGAKRLNDYFGDGEAGALAVVGKALQGDLDTIPKVIQASTLHHGKYTLKQIEEAVAHKVDNGEIDLYDLMKMMKEVVADSFFYKRAMDKMVKTAGENEMSQVLENFYSDTE